VESTFVGSGRGAAPGSPPISVIRGRPSRKHVEAEVFTMPTGLKTDPAAPDPFSAVSASWPAVQIDIGFGWEDVVVLEDVLVVDVPGTVDVVDEVDVVVGSVVVVAGVAAFEQPPAIAAATKSMSDPLAARSLERRNQPPGVGSGSACMAT